MNVEELHESNQENIAENTANEAHIEENQSLQEKLTAQVAEEKDKFLRLFAEFDNYKKRSQKERLEYFKYANQEILVALLPVLDDFERCVKELEKEQSQELEGVKLIQQKLNNALKDKGLQTIEVKIGDELDTEKHDAITQIAAPTAELKNKIVDVIETGYQLQDKVIRFAKVIVGN